MKTKNTRLVYTDEKNLKAYESLPAEDFKEFFMTYLTYQDGDDVSKTISNPFVQTLFMAAYADKIKYNEEKWENRAKSNKENGKKGGRPRKNNTDIEPNTEFETENKMSGTVTPIAEERQPNTQDVAKEEKQPQTTDLSDTFDNYSENLNDFLDENEQRINGWVSAISNGIVCKSNITEFPKEMAIKNIEKIITEYGTITKDALDFKEYMTERITDSIRQKRYERAVQSSYNA